MAIIKKSEFENMNEQTLQEKLIDLKKELMKFNSQRYSGTPPENPGRVREVRKTIARIYTKLSQKQQEIKVNKTENKGKTKTKTIDKKGKGVKSKA
ncbi:MAG: 50S ribosomal protein L29 [Candidatus Nanoarchaeia archaeon]|nr:50S ribosomal protein L29 [Candidatus Nanoarchaeia archaeon]